jgi:hypothetical protein
VRLGRYLLLSQLSLLSLLLVCCLLLPSVVAHNGGVSNFGNHRRTVIPYTLSFASSIAVLGLAALRLLDLARGLWRQAGLLLVLGLLESAVLLSTFPRHIAWTYSVIHDDLGIALFAYEFCWAVWLVTRRSSQLAVLLVLLQSLGSLAALLSILKIVHLLFVGQLVATVGFSFLLVGTFPATIKTDLARDRPGKSPRRSRHAPTG